MAIKAAVFDVGGVLVDWNPEHLYRKLIPDEAARKRFLSEVCPFSWNVQQDLGLYSWADAIAARSQMFPDQAELIRAYDERWPEMISAKNDTVALKNRLRAAGIPVYAITNYSSEKWALSLDLFPTLREFDGVIVSAHEKMLKPDPAIYRLLCSRYNLNPAECLFIDDVLANVEGAKAVGMSALHFTDPGSLRETLEDLFDLKAAA